MSRKILIVGGTSGLGRALAQLYAEEGCQVGIIGRRQNLLKEIEQQFPENVKTLCADISKPDADKTISKLAEILGGLDVIIIAASIVEFNPGLELETEIQTIKTNIEGFARVINTAWQYFQQTKNGQIVGITSIAAARGNKKAPAYHATKSFQSIYLESLRVKAKLDKNNIIVSELIPGYIDTAMAKGDRLFWVSSLQKAARQSKRAIDHKKAKAFITKRWWLVYHVQRILPIFIYDSLINGSWKLKNKT